MQMQRMDDTALKAYGRVLKSSYDESPALYKHPLELSAEQPIRLYCTSDKWIVDYDDGMSLLVICQDDDSKTKHVFYLDRPVELFAGVHFFIVPFQRKCSVLIYTPDEAELESVCSTIEANDFSYSTGLKLDKLYTFFYQESANNFFFRGESHEPLELIYVDKGTLHNVINGTDYSLEQESLIIISSNAWHIQHSKDSVCFMTVSFTLKDSNLPENSLNRIFVPNAQMKSIIRQMIAERDNQSIYFHDYLEGLLQILLINLVRSAASDGLLNTKPPLPSTEYASTEVLNRAIKIITDNIGKRISLEYLAAESFVSVSHLSKIFNTYLGMPPGKYINRIRLEECKRLLRETPMQISEVSKFMGYSSVQQFSKQFRHCFGISPTEYLKMIC